VNPVDIVILIVIGLFAVGGLRRGFLLGLIDLVALALAIVVAARFASVLADPLVNWGLTPELASGAGFLIAATAGFAVIGLAGRILLAPLSMLGAGTPIGWVNGVFGILPGAVRGTIVAALLLLVLYAMPPELGLETTLSQSRLAAPIARQGRELLSMGLAWAGIDAGDTGILDDFIGDAGSRSLILPSQVFAK
jgi:membrane protein required for colicin V production